MCVRRVSWYVQEVPNSERQSYTHTFCLMQIGFIDRFPCIFPCSQHSKAAPREKNGKNEKAGGKPSLLLNGPASVVRVCKSGSPIFKTCGKFRSNWSTRISRLALPQQQPVVAVLSNRILLCLDEQRPS